MTRAAPQPAFPLRKDGARVAAEEERAWLERIADADRLAFEQLYRRYHRRIFGYLFRLLGSGDAAEELANDVMVEVWKSADRFRGESSVSTWIFGISRFKALSYRRRAHPDNVEVEEANQMPDPGELQDQALEKKDLTARIRKVLGKLSSDHREVMELTFFEGFSYPEIARILECPVNTVKTRMFYARRQLRELLRVEGTP